MDATEAAAIIAGSAQVISSGINAAAQSSINKRTRQFNAEQAKIAREWEYERWKEANAYNSPLQQMQRLQDAHLNPAMVYSGSSNAGQAAGSLSTSAATWSPTAPRLDMTGAVNAAQMLLMKRKQDSDISLQNSQMEMMKQAMQLQSLQMATEVARARGIDASTKGQIISNSLAQATFDSNVRAAEERANFTHWQVRLAEMSYKEKEFQVERMLPLQALQAQVSIAATNAGINLTNQQISKLSVDIHNGILQGRLLNVDAEWQEMIKGKGIDPHAPWYLTSAYAGGFNNIFNDVIVPVWNQFEQFYNERFNQTPAQPVSGFSGGSFWNAIGRDIRYLPLPAQAVYTGINSLKQRR